MNIKQLRQLFQEQLKDVYPIEEINTFYFLLCEAYLDKTRIDLALNPTEALSEVKVAAFLKAIGQLSEECPVQYILGSTEFMGLPFEVDRNVLIPRPETEELISWILSDSHKIKHLLDIGTGSGCIPVVLAKHLSNARIDAMDISDKALEVAQRNASNNQVVVNFLQHNVLHLHALPATYDLIVSNPPYVRESEKKQMKNNVLKHEPELALYVPDEDPLLFYRHIAKLALTGLKNGGLLYFEINQYLGEELTALLKSLNFQNIELKKDIFGVHRMIRAVKK